MSWFRKAKGPIRTAPPEAPAEAAADPPDVAEPPTTDTVGNPIVQRSLRAAGARHAAPSAGPTRAEHRMLQFVAEGRVAWMVSGSAGFWRLDGAFATGPKAMMLDWLQQEGYLALGDRVRVTSTAALTDAGREVLDSTA